LALATGRLTSSSPAVLGMCSLGFILFLERELDTYDRLTSPYSPSTPRYLPEIDLYMVLDEVYSSIISAPFILRLKMFHSSFILNLLAVSSIFWSAHLITVSIPASQSTDHNLAYLVTYISPALFSFTFLRLNHLFSFGGGLTPGTLCLPTSDVSHHHISIGFLIIFLSTLTSQLNNCISYRLLGYAHRSTFTYGSIDSSIESYNGKLSLSLSVLGCATSLLAQHTYSLCPYPLLSLDPTSSLALYSNHQ
jgi:hypothetical protein